MPNVKPNLEDILEKIVASVKTAQEKHPIFAVTPEEAFKVVLSEHLEWQSQAMMITRANGGLNMTRVRRAEEESLDCIATHIRFLLRDYSPFNPA